MAVKIAIGLDLGSDTFKVAFALKNGRKIEYGKINKDMPTVSVAIPSIAYYDEKTNKWLFGDDVYAGEEKSFVNIVKIKKLLSLLKKDDSISEYIQENNQKFYKQKNNFPKFYFPQRKGMLKNFSDMVVRDMTFVAKNTTPQQVCEAYFTYIAKIVESRLKVLCKKYSIESYDLEIALIYPPRVGQDYKDELERLTEVAFGIAPKKVLSTIKAVSMFAAHKGTVKSGESLIIFNLGEEYTSTAKVNLSNDATPRVSIEGADGHNQSVRLGGNDIDDSIANYIENKIYKRETMGTPSYNKEGHIFEKGLHSKQFLFINDIKSAKMILSKPMAPGSLFTDGVPVSISRDLYIQRRLTKDEIKKCVGISEGNGVAKKIIDYISAELNRPLNRNVKKIVVTGGVVETFALEDYIKSQIQSKFPHVNCFTFEEFPFETDAFTINSHESSIYSVAVGGAIVALEDYDVQATLALSYGTWVGLGSHKGGIFLKLIVDRGTTIAKGGMRHFESDIGISTATSDYFYSTYITRDDINNTRVNKFPGLKDSDFVANGSGFMLRIGESINGKLQYYTRVAEAIGLKIVSGENGGKIEIKYKNQPISIMSVGGTAGQISIREGMEIDQDGFAVPFAENDTKANGNNVVLIKYANGTTEKVYASSIKAGLSNLQAVQLEGSD